MKKTYNFIKKETLTQAFFCEFCKISKNTFFTEHLWTTATGKVYCCLFFSYDTNHVKNFVMRLC